MSDMEKTMEENKNIAPEAQNEELREEEVHYKELSPTRVVVRRFFRSRLSLIGVLLLVALFAFAFIGPPVMYMFGYQWSETETDHTPTIVRDVQTTKITTTDVKGNEYPIIQVVDGVVGINKYAPISGNHLLGTDEKGMDVFIRLMYGGRISLTLGFVVVILETIIGIIMGGISGYFGGKVDQLIMRIVDILNCVPTLPILLIASVVIDSWEIESSMRIYYLMLIMTVFGWSGTARMVRGQILYLREQEYIVACEVMGIPTWRRIFKHLVPNIMPQLIVSMTLGLGGIILYESTLSYLGLGIPLPYAAWGTMISSSTNPATMQYYPNLWIPAGILIVIAVLAFNFVGDGLRDAMDPKSKR
jgi:peptide/nickel transport system permease protein